MSNAISNDMITDYDAHVMSYMKHLWREYLEWKLESDNRKFWLSKNENTHH